MFCTKKLAVFVLTLLCLSPAALAEREFIDMAGRTVVVPDEITRAFGLEPAASTFLLAAAPDAIAAWNCDLNEDERCYLPQPAMELGSLEAEPEAIKKSGAQVLVWVGDVGETSQAEAIACDAGLPLVCLSDAIRDIPEAIALLGRIFGTDVAAQVDYARRVLADETEIEQKVRVYWGVGNDSLRTLPAGHALMEAIGLAGGENAANIWATELADVTAEELTGWDPEVIFTGGARTEGVSSFAAAEAILADARYQEIDAVRNGRVYAVPNLPFSLLEPAGPNRLLGVVWARKILHPEAFAETDPAAETLAFYRTFYHLDMNEDDVTLFLSRF